MIKVIKKEILIYLAILIALALYMHPERITIIESPFQLAHAFAWAFGAYLVVAIIRGIVGLILKFFRNNQ